MTILSGPLIISAARHASFERTEGVFLMKDSVVREVSQGRYRSGGRYKLLVRYQYEVDGTQFTSEQATLFSDNFEERRNAEHFADLFEIGDDVRVYYDPVAPSRCCLVPPDGFALSGGLRHLLYLLIFWFIGGSSAWGAILLIRMPRPNSAENLLPEQQHRGR